MSHGCGWKLPAHAVSSVGIRRNTFERRPTERPKSGLPAHSGGGVAAKLHGIDEPRGADADGE